MRTNFDNHAFARYDGKVYDACAGPTVGTDDEAGYIGIAVDKSTGPEADPAVSGSTTNIVPGDVTDIK